MVSFGRLNKAAKVSSKPSLSSISFWSCFTLRRHRKVNLKASACASWYSRRAVRKFNIAELLIVIDPFSC